MIDLIRNIAYGMPPTSTAARDVLELASELAGIAPNDRERVLAAIAADTGGELYVAANYVMWELGRN